MTNACAHSVVLSEGLGGGRVLQVEHSGSELSEGMVVAAIGSDGVGASRVSVQQGGGPTTGRTGGRRSWKDVAMSVGSVTLLDVGRSRSGFGDAVSSKGVNDVFVPTALSVRSKCLVMS